MPSADLLTLGPAASMTDSTGVGPAAGSGTFSALLKQQGGGLHAAPAGASAEQTQAGASEDSALAAAPVSATSLPIVAQPPAEALGLSWPPNPHHPADVRQLPARPAGENLPPIGNALPQQPVDQLSATAGVRPPESLQLPTPIARAGIQGSPETEEPGLTPGPAPGSEQNGASRMRAEPGSAVSRAFEVYGPAASKTSMDARALEPQAAVLAAQAAARAPQDAVSAAWSPISGATPKLSHAPNPGEVRSDAPVSGTQSLMAAIQARYKPESATQTPIQPDSVSAVRFADPPVVSFIPGTQAPIASSAEGGSSLILTASGGAPNGLPGGTSRTLEAPFGSGSWGSELAGHLRSLAGEGNVHRAELRLNPAHLGPVEVRLSLRGDETNVTFVAAEGVVRDALQETLPRLRELLAEQGLNLGQTRVLDQHSANPGDREAAYRQFAGEDQADAAESAGSEAGHVTGPSRSSSGRPSSLVDAYI